MKKIISYSILALSALMLIASCKTKAPEIEGYKLMWHDEFDGKKLNSSYWNREVRPAGWTNHELQAYTEEDENIYVEDGKLVLRALQFPLKSGSFYYTSGKVQTSNKVHFTYGKVVARAKAPKGKGLWPAIWMMPSEDKFGNWPVSGEIDIMEVLGNETNKTYGTIHYGSPHAQKQGTYITPEGTPDFSDDFHIYEVEWEPGIFRWYIDGNLFYVENNWFAKSRAGENFDYPAPFNEDFFIQLNLAVGGDWPGKPGPDTDFENAKFEIDYVRVYQKEHYDTNVTKPTAKVPEPDENGNYIHNSFFSYDEPLNDGKDWTFLTASAGEGKATIVNGSLKVETVNAGTVAHSIQVVHPGINMKKGTKYRIQFDAKADEARKIRVAITAPEVNWTRYFPDTETDIGTEWKTYTYEFTMNYDDDPFGRLEYNMGRLGSTSTVYFKNVTVTELK